MAGRKTDAIDGKKGGTDFFTTNLVIAVLLGALLITISYFPFETAAGGQAPIWQHVLHAATHEIGFAFIVAAVIWRMFEFFAQKESALHWSGIVEEISQNVFRAVLKTDHPEAMITEAFRLILDQQLVRYGFNVHYTLSDASLVNRNNVELPYVKLDVLVTYKVKNVSKKKATLPIQMHLPNPMLNELKDVCLVKAVKVNEKEENLEAAEAAFRAAIANDLMNEVPFFVRKLDIEPGEEFEISLHHQLAKQVEDVEFVMMGFPASSVEIMVTDRGPTRRAVRASAIHPGDLKTIAGSELDGPWIFRLERFFLPYQGFRFWWKTIPQDVLDAAAKSRR